MAAPSSTAASPAKAVSTGRWTLHPNRVRADVWGVEQLPGLLDRLRPDLVWIVYDAIRYLVHRELLAAWPTVLYCPIDGIHPEPASVRHLAGLARPVLFTAGARRAVESAASAATVLPRIEIIPHGVDTRPDLTIEGFAHAERAYRTATAPHLGWRHIASQWQNLFAALGANI